MQNSVRLTGLRYGLTDVMEISVITDEKVFHELRDEWNTLLGKSKSQCIFLRWEWLYTWWSSYRERGDQLNILVVRQDGKTIGIAPLYLRKRYLNALREITFLGSNVVCSDYLDFILMEGVERETLLTMLSFVRKNGYEWDVIRLTDMPSESGSIPILQEYFGSNRVEVDLHYRECPFIDLGGRWESACKGVSASQGMNIRRKVRKFSELPGSAFFEVETKAELNWYFDEFVRLNKLRMRMKRQRSPFSDDEFVQFHRRILDQLFDAGMAKLCFLKIGDDLVAGIYLLFFGEKYYYYQSGFDPAWRRLSPGTVMFYFCIQDAVGRGAKEFDLLQGGEDYKYSWTKRKRLNAKAVVYNGTAKGEMAKTVHEYLVRVRSFVREQLGKGSGMKEGCGSDLS